MLNVIPTLWHLIQNVFKNAVAISMCQPHVSLVWTTLISWSDLKYFHLKFLLAKHTFLDISQRQLYPLCPWIFILTWIKTAFVMLGGQKWLCFIGCTPRQKGDRFLWVDFKILNLVSGFSILNRFWAGVLSLLSPDYVRVNLAWCYAIPFLWPCVRHRLNKNSYWDSVCAR